MHITFFGINGDWLLDAKDLTIWDCLGNVPHTFDLATVEGSWDNYDSDENHDYVYFPVRYRQPFQYADPVSGQQIGNDDTVSVYMLRPAISEYWLLVRGFRLLGYKIDSQFLNTANYFRRFTWCWTHGDFYDLNSQLIQSACFKASGPILPYYPLPTDTGEALAGSGHIWYAPGAFPSADANNGAWQPWASGFSGTPTSGTGYIQSLTETYTVGGATAYHNFRISNTAPPRGSDNFLLYSFDEVTGSMKYHFNPPPEIAQYISANISIQFTLNLIAKTFCSVSGGHTKIIIEKTVIPTTGPSVVTNEDFDELTALASEIKGNLQYPTVHKFTVDNVNIGDIVQIRLKWDSDSILDNIIRIVSSGYVNVNPAGTGASSWQYNFGTQHWQNVDGNLSGSLWQNMYSSLEMTGLVLQLGNTVNFKNYDRFRSYKFTDFLKGIVDRHNLSIQSDSKAKIGLDR